MYLLRAIKQIFIQLHVYFIQFSLISSTTSLSQCFFSFLQLNQLNKLFAGLKFVGTLSQNLLLSTFESFLSFKYPD